MRSISMSDYTPEEVGFYTPDNWVVIKFTQQVNGGKTEKVFYKVLGGWSGGYLDGDGA